MGGVRVIEAFWAADRLQVWGLASDPPATTTSRKRIRSHPYALDHAALTALLEPVLSTAPEPGTANLHLPGIPRHPVPPPGFPTMAGAPTYRPERVTVRPWQVPTLELVGPDTLAPLRDTGIRVGSRSLPHLAALLEAAENLCSARRVIPRLVEEHVSLGGTYTMAVVRARWRPVLDATARSWLRGHVQALPPASRAHHPADLDPHEAGADAMADALAALCALTDLIARERLADHVVDLPNTPGVQHQWLDALTGTDGDLDHHGPLPERSTVRLLDDLGEWFAAAHRFAGAIRLAFRLVEPAPEPVIDEADDLDESEDADEGETLDEDEDEDAGQEIAAGLYVPADRPWLLQTWVQSVEEPSLMVPLDRLREGEGADWLPPDHAEPVARSLSQAARVCPLLVRALGADAPGTLELTPGEACDVLARHAAALREAGFGVLLPTWVGDVGVRTTLTLAEHGQHRPENGTGIGQALVDVDYRAAIGDVDLTLAELTELARLKRPLVRLRGEWAHLDPAQLRRAADYLSGREPAAVSAGEALRLALVPDPDAPGQVDVEADGDLGDLLSGRAEQAFVPMAEPPGLEAELRPYQRRGAAWLRYLDRLGLGAVLADDMGLGKTVQVLALLAHERSGDEGRPAPTLVVCPTSLVGNWCKEAARFAPKLRVHPHHGPKRPRGEDLARAVEETDLVVTTYGVMLRDAEALSAVPWARVVCDEAQHIKNSRTKQAGAAREIPAPSRIALTGTPVENHLGELWSILDFANPGLLGPRQAFEKGIAADIQRDPATDAGQAATARLRRVTAPFVLRRLKTDTSIISDLPAKQEMKAWCTLTAEQASLYKATVDEMTALIDEATGIRRKGLVLATMTKLKQVCNHPAHLLGDGSRLAGRSGKLAHLEELLTEMAAEGDKALCFTQYTEFGSRLAPYLEGKLGMPVLWLHGGTPRAKREAMVERFQTADGPMLFLLSLKAAGTGLNLTAAKQVVHVDRWWNPAVEDQATDRAFRIGQRRNVQVRKMVCVGTLEERVDALLERKKHLAEAVVGAGEDWLGNMSVAELREVVRLAPEAVS